jgi:hypothetical protein
VDVSSFFGIAASWIEERSAAARGQLEQTPTRFEPCQTLPFGGVLLLVPFLQANGLASYTKHYCELDKGYYYIDFIVLLLAFMYLCRIKNPEQLKHIDPGEFGKLLGVDRVPEAKCLRNKIKQICEQEKSGPWNAELASTWSKQEDNEFYYIDGHVQVYHGYKARLGKKHVSRQKLCLPGMQEFWVNNAEGMPYFFVTGKVNEKLLEMLAEQIIPDLLGQVHQKYSPAELAAEADLPRFTIVFDREAYSPVFFRQLWQTHRIAVITYRKKVTDQWDRKCFSGYPIAIDETMTEMELAEKPVELNGVAMREIRRLSGDGHQTSVITTNAKLDLQQVAQQMFARWAQENFFRYMRQNYDFDRLLQYAVQQIDGDFTVTHPGYNKLSHKIKKVREKISRRKAALYDVVQTNVDQQLDRASQNHNKHALLQHELDGLIKQEQILLDGRSKIPGKIKLKDMPDDMRYSQLHRESKHFQNIIKMICYRAESAFANLLGPYYNKSINEKRALVKTIINTPVDLKPDYDKKILHVQLYTLSTPRDNRAVHEVCETLNQTTTRFPGTDLVLHYKSATSHFT